MIPARRVIVLAIAVPLAIDVPRRLDVRLARMQTEPPNPRRSSGRITAARVAAFRRRLAARRGRIGAWWWRLLPCR